MISIRRQPAVQTQMPALSQRLFHARTTGAYLASSPRINLHEQPTSIFRFVGQQSNEVSPSGVENRLTQFWVLRHPVDIQVFDRNESVRVYERPRKVVVEIASLIPDVIMEPLKQQDRFEPAVRSFLSTGNTSLQTSQFCLRPAKPSRVFDTSSIAKGRERGQSDVNADSVAAKRQWRSLRFYNKQSEPAPRLPFYGKGFNQTHNRTMQIDANPANPRQSQFASFYGLSDLPKREAVIPSCGAKSGIAWRFAIPNTSKEPLKRRLYALQGVFQHIRVNCTHVLPQRLDFGKLFGLIKIRDRFALPLPCFTPFSDTRVVEFAANCKLLIQNLFLPFGGVDSIAEGLDHANILLLRFSYENKERANNQPER